MIIDEATQCETGKRTQGKLTVLLQMWTNSSRATRGDEEHVEREDNTGNDSLEQFAVAKRKKPEAMQDLSIQNAQKIKQRSITPAEQRKINLQVVQKFCKTRRSPQVHARKTAARTKQWIASEPQNMNNMNNAARAGGIRKWLLHCSDHSQTAQHDTHA